MQGKQGWRDGGVEPNRGEGAVGRREGGKEMQMKEKAVTDSGERWQGTGGEMEERRETEEGNPAGVPSTSASSAAGTQPQPGD